MGTHGAAWACTSANGPGRQRINMILQRMGAHAAVSRSGWQGETPALNWSKQEAFEVDS